MSLGAGIIVGVAEAAVYAAYLRNVEVAKQREGGRREIKSVVAMEKIGTESPEWNEGVDAEGKEEIWGKGVNGGLRRRVRERWEKGQMGVEREDGKRKWKEVNKNKKYWIN